MSNRFVLFLALRYFSAKKDERFISFVSAISLVSVILGVAALMVVMSVMNGFRVKLTDSIVGLNGDIRVLPVTKIFRDQDALVQRLSAYPGVTRVMAIADGQAFASSAVGGSGVAIKGINLNDLQHKHLVDNVFEGSFSNFRGNDTIAVGVELAKNLRLHSGSKVTMISANVLSTIFGSMPRMKDFTVVAIFSSGMYEYDAMTVLMPLRAAQLFLSLGDGLNLVEVSITESERAEALARQIQQDVGSDLHVASWQVNSRQLFEALEVEKVAMFTILSLITLVAAFNIVSNLFMLVKDKTTDIGILRTMGASSCQIMAIFITNGMLIGSIGTQLGVILGFAIANNVESIRKLLEKFSGVSIFDPAIYFLYSLPSVVKFSDALMISVFSLVLCLLATIYPAYKAAKLSPVDVMRYE